MDATSSPNVKASTAGRPGSSGKRQAGSSSKRAGASHSSRAKASTKASRSMSRDRDAEEQDVRYLSEGQFKMMCRGMSLSICYAANCGGLATLTGTPPNLVIKNKVDVMYEDKRLTSPVHFANWMAFMLPLSTFMLIVSWVGLQIAFLRGSNLFDCMEMTRAKRNLQRRVQCMLSSEYRKLGPMSFAEGAVLFWFVVLVVLWVTREMGGYGWEVLFKSQDKHEKGMIRQSYFVNDSTPAILVGIILFVFPAYLPWRQPSRCTCCRRMRAHSTCCRRLRVSDSLTSGRQNFRLPDDPPVKYKPLLEWSDAHTKIPWSIFILLGGGFALSEGFEASKLSEEIANRLLVGLKDYAKEAVLFIFIVFASVLTEITSNTATAILVMPIVSRVALDSHVHPLYYMLPVGAACSFAFILPVATPSNALVFSAGQVRVVDMVLAGLMLNIFLIPVLIFATHTWGYVIFDFSNPPAALFNKTLSNDVSN